MISVVICSISPSFLEQVQNNIKNTIGVPYEFLFYNNNQDPKGICAVYNLLAEQAQFPYICFVHEDVIFQTKDWGKIIIELYKNPSTGLIGVAGSKYKSSQYSGWYTGMDVFDCANIVHRNGNQVHKMYLSPNSDSSSEKVVCLDGVFICTRKEIWEQIRFNEVDLKGFHYYDIDFSLRAAHFYDVLVTYDIQIIHLTLGGDFGENWIKTTFLYHQNINRQLPFTIVKDVPENTDQKIMITMLDVLKNYNISWKNKFKWISDQRLYANPKFFYPIFKFLFYYPFGLKYLHNYFKK